MSAEKYDRGVLRTVLEFAPRLRKPRNQPTARSLIESSKPYRDFQDAQDRVAAILATTPAEIDLLQRHLLCAATGLHDPGPDGTCRDCRTVVAPSDPVCADDVLIHAQPDEDQQ